MPREKASINLDIWGDDSWRDLTDPAQSLYYKLMSYKLDYCGVGDFHPGRLAALTREQTPDDIMRAAQELSETYWCVFDQDTDEVMVRGYLRHDGVLKQPRLAVSAALAYSSIASNKIRAVVVHEIQRFKKENPDLAAWDKPQMKTLLKQQAVSVKDTVTDLVWDFSLAHAQTYAQRLPQTSVTPMTGATTDTGTSTGTDTSSNEDSLPKIVSSPQGLTSGIPVDGKSSRLGVAS